MRRGAMLLAASAATMVVAACGSGGELNIRSVSTTIKQEQQPVPARIAEARGYFALGNVGLALEAFRKALRDDPASVDALNGIAACYDKMGRFEVSRRFYEQALALAPGDARLYANLALSLEMQGRTAEAASVRTEMAQRLTAGQAATVELAQAAADGGAEAQPALASAPILQSEPVTITPTAPVVTVALAAPEPVEVAQPAPVGARLQRLSLGEVALVTGGKPVWRPRMAERADNRASPVRLTLLNAARVEGLAARTRSVLQDRGWRRIAIGNAPRVEPRSVIAYPASRRAEAVRLSQQFGFALRHRPSADGRLTVLLGRDAAVPRAGKVS